ncbi:DivIVA domain-containing protein [Streptomyces sp. CdTB01]|uniref:DivIVA domain-containing protein n=1 Tax=Streptomyces sp. CdTB01 TaxID=1725411 RepID=UPI00073A6AB5|nr:DivIVA domain-containing protein [Streptomyces sp. CdTB01]ALV39210.1 hypothetical protein AS200_44715 [Streptomyces sp. CdTB01]
MGDACCDEEPDPLTASADPTDRHPSGPGTDRPLLTPDDVHHKRFPTVRLREGYEFAGVDTFMHQVEYTVDRLYKEINVLRSRPPAQVAAAARQTTDDAFEASRIIALADRDANDTVAAARTQASQIVNTAHAQADDLVREAQGRAEQIEHEIAQRTLAAEQVVRDKRAEAEAHDRVRINMERQLAELRSLVTEYRNRLQENLDGRWHDIEHKANQYHTSTPTPIDGPHQPAWQPNERTANQPTDNQRWSA